MKKILIVLMSCMLLIAVSSLQAQAGSKQRYRWEEIAIGIGASILSNALLNYQRPYPGQYPPSPGYYPSGHWDMKKVRWVPPIYEKKRWVDGYYGYNGRWFPGRWEGRWIPGYWVMKRVWVRDRANRYYR